MSILRFVTHAVACCLLVLGGGARALEVTAKAADIPDVSPGIDLWDYELVISGSLLALEAVEFNFDPTLAKDFHVVSQVDTNTFAVASAPSFGGGSPGLLRFSTVQDVPTPTSVFTVEFTRVSGMPGALEYTYYDNQGNIALEGTTTTPNPVPEPASALLMLGALGFAPLLRRAH